MARQFSLAPEVTDAMRAFVTPEGAEPARGRFKTADWVAFLSLPENRQHTRALAEATGVAFNGRKQKHGGYSKNDLAAVEQVAKAVR